MKRYKKDKAISYCPPLRPIKLYLRIFVLVMALFIYNSAKP